MRPLTLLSDAVDLLRGSDGRECVRMSDVGALRDRLAISNTLLGLAEREVVEAEGAAVAEDLGDLLGVAAREVTRAAGWLPEALVFVHQWRAARLEQTLCHTFPDPGIDPIGAAARDAAALCALLLTCREAAAAGESTLPSLLLHDMEKALTRVRTAVEGLAAEPFRA